VPTPVRLSRSARLCRCPWVTVMDRGRPLDRACNGHADLRFTSLSPTVLGRSVQGLTSGSLSATGGELLAVDGGTGTASVTVHRRRLTDWSAYRGEEDLCEAPDGSHVGHE
jgi:hypothetical protein